MIRDEKWGPGRISGELFNGDATSVHWDVVTMEAACRAQ